MKDKEYIKTISFKLKKNELVKVRKADFFKKQCNYRERRNYVYYGKIFSAFMFTYCGKTFKIHKVIKDPNGEVGCKYIILFKGLDHLFNEWMLENISKQLELF